MHRRVSRAARLALAVAILLATVVVPLAMTGAPAPTHEIHHGDASHRQAPRHEAHHATCCDLCLIRCGTAVPLAMAAGWRQAPTNPVAVSVPRAEPRLRVSVRPHDLPPALGPPPLRA